MPSVPNPEFLRRAIALATENVVTGKGGPFAASYDAIVRMNADHPGDIGLVCSLLMNHRVVEPGQALFMDAGGIHAYIRGVGIELMANSDNVIRAGLTPKHIDVPELLKLTNPAVRVPLIESRPLGDGVSVYDSPAPEFRLYLAELGSGAVSLPGTGGARVVLCTEGAGTLRTSSATLKVAKGESCYLSAADGSVTASGPAVLFIAGSGIDC